MKKQTGFSRRTFVAGCGALPVLAGIFDPRRRARAATTSGSPLRLLIWAHQEGALRDQHMPTGDDTAFSLGPAVKALEPWKSRMLVIDGIHNTAGEQHLQGDTHEKAYSGLLTGNTVKQRIDPPLIAPSESLDQFLGPKIRGPARLSSLELTCNPGMSDEGICYPIGGGTQMPMLGKPSLVFDRLFSGVTGGGPVVDQKAADRARIYRTSVLDYVQKDLTSLTAKLGTEDRRKVQAHLDAIRDLEKEAATPAVAGASCGMPTRPVDNDPKDATTIPSTLKTMSDLIVQAFACDATRLITFTPSQSGSPGAPWLGDSHDLHLLSHGKYPEIPWPPLGAKWMTWMYEQQAYLLQRLASVPEGDGTLLDHTLILNIHDFSDSGAHNFKNLHTALIGSANGFFKQGRLMKLGGKPHNSVLVAVANAMGVDIKTFGDATLVDPAIVASFRA